MFAIADPCKQGAEAYLTSLPSRCVNDKVLMTRLCKKKTISERV